MITQPKVIYDSIEGLQQDSMIRYFKHRIFNRNNSVNIVITGPTGSGKTWWGGAFGEKWSKETGIPFNANEFVFFDLVDFFRLANRDGLDRLPRGTLLLFDEPQVAVNSRTWQSQQNIALSHLLSIARSRNFIVLFCTPYFLHLDKQIRHFIHWEFAMNDIDFNTKTSSVRPYFLDYSEKMDKFYTRWLDIYYPEVGKSSLSNLNLELYTMPMPSKAWIDIYEQRKLQFQKDFSIDMQKKLERSRKKQQLQDKRDAIFDNSSIIK